jgi:hypothetical protein
MQFRLEIGNNYIGDAESRAEYIVEELKETALRLSFERPNPLNNQIKERVVMGFEPK